MNTDSPRSAGLEALSAALLDIERFVGHGGWDQPARLFALVPTDDIIAQDPELAERLGLRGTAAGAPDGGLTSIEQEDFHAGDDLGDVLATVAWPSAVHGCALAVERVFLPPAAEAGVPADPDAAAAYAAAHPDRDEIRLVVGALRDGGGAIQQCAARIKSRPELLLGAEIAPALAGALSETLTTPADGANPAGPDEKEGR